MTQRGNATGLFNLTRELGGSLGTAWMGKVVADGISRHASQLGEHVSWFDGTTQEQARLILGRGLDPVGIFHGRVIQQAMVLSFEDGFRLTTLAIACGLIMIAILKKPRIGPAPAGAH
jgi:DHA2 family multidrug resistance protein